MTKTTKKTNKPDTWNDLPSGTAPIADFTLVSSDWTDATDAEKRKQSVNHEFCNSIKSGIINPIIITREPSGKLRVRAGRRRFWAAKKVRLATVPYRDASSLSEEQLRQLIIYENLYREDVDPCDLYVRCAEARYRKDGSRMKLRELVQHFNGAFSQSTIAQFSRIGRLCKSAMTILREVPIEVRPSRDKLAPIGDMPEEKQVAALRQLLSGKRKVRGPKKAKLRATYETASSALELAEFKVETLKGPSEMLAERSYFQGVTHALRWITFGKDRELGFDLMSALPTGPEDEDLNQLPLSSTLPAGDAPDEPQPSATESPADDAPQPQAVPTAQT